ncbi:hypothetical protein [Salegentibacter sp. UBA1130]|jgi:hypothetical protein|uniref:Uncharacterized protein n=2 Tax=Flavobacteriaceae TaxID=49546 RepID=A0A1I2M345_9FLAO|nr:hypothetical protein [Salegentibacter sp. UBA1130]SFF85972.1 hypothetical protein SAMN04488033_111125 [Salegentibacter agarivorans]|tara:strand:- start:208 stop:360 length:153 start_codon:yes stop_codon:yes gene_type:complete
MKQLPYIRVGTSYYKIVAMPTIAGNFNEVSMLYNILSGIESFKALGYGEI